METLDKLKFLSGKIYDASNIGTISDEKNLIHKGSVAAARFIQLFELSHFELASCYTVIPLPFSSTDKTAVLHVSKSRPRGQNILTPGKDDAKSSPADSTLYRCPRAFRTWANGKQNRE